MMNEELEDIEIIEIKEEGKKYKLNFAMLLAEVRRRRLFTGNNKIIIRVGAYKCIFEVLEENFDD